MLFKIIRAYVSRIDFIWCAFETGYNRSVQYKLVSCQGYERNHQNVIEWYLRGKIV